MARMEIMRPITVIIVAFQNVRDEKRASPAKFPGRPIFPQVSKERPASSRREYRQAARCVAAPHAPLSNSLAERFTKQPALSRPPLRCYPVLSRQTLARLPT